MCVWMSMYLTLRGFFSAAVSGLGLVRAAAPEARAESMNVRREEDGVGIIGSPGGSTLAAQKLQEVTQLLRGHDLFHALRHQGHVRWRHLLHVLAGDADFGQLGRPKVQGLGAFPRD